MVKKICICIILVAITNLFACNNVSTESLPEPNKLKLAIGESIQIPFEEIDTVIYNSFIGICGNSSKDELNRYYEPQLNFPPYSTILTDHYNGQIWFTGEELYAKMDSLCKERKKEESVWDCFSKNKIDFYLTGKTITNNSVEIYERYFLNEEIHSINKVFEYDRGIWNHEITLNELK